MRNDDEDVLAQQIEQEGAKSPADVFYTENTPPLALLDEKGLLAPIDAASLAAVPATDSATDHDWIGVSARVSELVYNTKDLTPAQLPTSVLDLADPKWKGKLDIAPSETDFQPIVTAVASDIGDAATVTWLKALKANAGSHQDPDNETLVANVNKGTTELGVINHYYWYRLRDEVGACGMHSALQNFAPHDAGYLLDISGAGVLKSSKHQAAAQALVAFLVSDAGQKVLASGDSWEYPIGSGVTNPKLPPMSGSAAEGVRPDPDRRRQQGDQAAAAGGAALSAVRDAPDRLGRPHRRTAAARCAGSRCPPAAGAGAARSRSSCCCPSCSWCCRRRTSAGPSCIGCCSGRCRRELLRNTVELAVHRHRRRGRDRDGRGLVYRAHGAAASTGLGGTARPAGLDPGLRRRLLVALDRAVVHRAAGGVRW